MNRLANLSFASAARTLVLSSVLLASFVLNSRSGLAQCVPPPAGLVSWWRGEGDALDQLGNNPGILVGNTSFGAGQVGRGFVFDGSGDGVQVGNPPSLQLQDFTIEAWVKRGNFSVVSPSGPVGFIFDYGSSGYGFGVDNSGALILTKVGVNSVTTGPLLTDVNFHHL